MSLRILHCNPSFDPAYGGPVEGTLQLSRALREQGGMDEVVSLDAPGSDCLEGCPLTIHAVGRGRGNYRYSPALVPWLDQHARQYDAVIVHGIWTYAGLGTWRALAGRQTPYFVYPHGMLDPWFKRTYPLKQLKKWLYWPWAEYRVLRDAAGVFFTCEEERVLARRSFWLYQAREEVVRYGIADPVGNPRLQKAAFFARYPELESKRLLLFLARLHPKKGCDLLLRAFAALLENEREPRRLHLVMAGPDPVGWKSNLEKLAHGLGIASHVTWTGMLTGELKWGALRVSELFVLTSHQENFGVAVVEALACGIPVLITPGVNIWREVVEDGGGWACTGDVPAITHYLQHWSRLDDSAQDRTRRCARTCFERRFDIRRQMSHWLATVHRAVHAPTRLPAASGGTQA